MVILNLCIRFPMVYQYRGNEMTSLRLVNSVLENNLHQADIESERAFGAWIESIAEVDDIIDEIVFLSASDRIADASLLAKLLDSEQCRSKMLWRCYSFIRKQYLGYSRSVHRIQQDRIRDA